MIEFFPSPLQPRCRCFPDCRHNCRRCKASADKYISPTSLNLAKCQLCVCIRKRFQMRPISTCFHGCPAQPGSPLGHAGLRRFPPRGLEVPRAVGVTRWRRGAHQRVVLGIYCTRTMGDRPRLTVPLLPDQSTSSHLYFHLSACLLISTLPLANIF